MPEWHQKFMRVVNIYPSNKRRRGRRDTYYVYFDKEKGDRANVFRSFTKLYSFRKNHFKADEFKFLDEVKGGSYKFVS